MKQTSNIVHKRPTVVYFFQSNYNKHVQTKFPFPLNHRKPGSTVTHKRQRPKYNIQALSS